LRAILSSDYADEKRRQGCLRAQGKPVLPPRMIRFILENRSTLSLFGISLLDAMTMHDSYRNSFSSLEMGAR
jgi:hypothetical protein